MKQLIGRRPLRTRVYLAASVCAALGGVGCPQILDDDFKKAPGETLEGTGGVSTASNGAGIGGRLNLGGTGPSTGGSNGEAGAEPTASGGTSSGTSTSLGSGGNGGNGGNGGSGGNGGNGGSGGTTIVNASEPAVLVYATDEGEVLARPWQDTAFGDPVVWNTTDETVAFVEARLHPNRQSGVVAYQTTGSDQCSLWVHLHHGTESQTPVEIPISSSDKCLTTRSFDVAYERLSGTGILVYAADDQTLAYRTIVDQQLSDPITINRGSTSELDWLRLAVDPSSDRIALGFTAAGTQTNDLVGVLWDGDSWGSSEPIARGGPVLGSQSFDLAFNDDLLAVRADDSDDGIDYAWMQGSTWGNEQLLSGAPGWDVTYVELMTTPEGIAGIAIDTLGDNARLGTFFHDGESFTEADALDLTMPPTTELQPATLKADVGLLGDNVVAVYPTDYVGGSAIGWAMRAAGSNWTLMEGEEPDLEQMSRGAIPWSLRLAPLPGPDAGLILTFVEEQGLYFTYLTNLDVGWATPVLVEASVSGADFTPFDVSSID